MTSKNLGQLRICVQKQLPDEWSIIKTLDTKKAQASFFKEKLWPPNSTIKIQFLSDGSGVEWTPIATLLNQKNSDGSGIKLDPLEKTVRKLPVREAIKKIITERFKPITNLNFKFVNNGGDVRISFNPLKGSFSLLGTDCKESDDLGTMNFAWLDVGTIIHEFGHVLGLIHEHQNPEGVGIPWDEEKVYKWARETQKWDEKTTYRNIIQKYDKNQLNSSLFDPNSVMLYFFSSKLTTNGVGTNSNRRLSITDIEWIMNTYPPSNPRDPQKIFNEWYSSRDKSNWLGILSVINSIFLLAVGIIFVLKYWR